MSDSTKEIPDEDLTAPPLPDPSGGGGGRSNSPSNLPDAPKRSNSTKALSMMADEVASSVSVNKDTTGTGSGGGDRSFKESLERLATREKELCSRRRMLTQDDVTDFAEVHRVLAQNCKTDEQTMAVIGRMQKFLNREEVQRTLSISRQPRVPSVPTVVERHPDGFLVRWRSDKSDRKNAEYQHYELQYGFRFMGSWHSAHVVSKTQYRIVGLRPATTYQFRLRALNPLGWSPFTKLAQATTRKVPKARSQREEGTSGGVFSMIGSIPGAYDELVNSIIRPPRAEYETRELGARRFRIGRKIYSRKDFTLLNSSNLNLACSHWEPVPEQRKNKKMPLLIYLHGNCGCRVDAIECLEGALGGNMTLLGVDLSGSGMSEGEYITLGWKEKSDVRDLIKHMRSNGTVSDIFLWGRSMGAVTALLCASMPGAEKKISGIVLDSPFSDLWDLALELVESQNLNIPSMATSMAKMLIRSSVKSRTHMDINDLSPIREVPKARVPALFCAARGDNFVKSHHSLKLLDAYGGPKELQLIDGDHNSARPPSFMSMAIKFLHSCENGHLSQRSRNGTENGAMSTAASKKPEEKTTPGAVGTSGASTTASFPLPSSPSSSTAKNSSTDEPRDVFNVKSMQSNLFQSHKERQYAKGMAINETLKMEEEPSGGA